MKALKEINMSLEATLTVMIDELKKLNENITEHNDIMLSHEDLSLIKARQIMDLNKVPYENRTIMWIDEKGIEHIVSTGDNGELLQHSKSYKGE
jgi:hypothetical protein